MSLASLQDQLEHYAAVKARLGVAGLPRPVLVRKPLALPAGPDVAPPAVAVAAVAPVAAPVMVPLSLNMLAPCSWRFLVTLVAAKHKVSKEALLGYGRSSHLVAARYEAMSLIYQHTGASLPRIGLYFTRDHTTVLHALRKRGVTKRLVEVPYLITGRPVKAAVSDGLKNRKYAPAAGKSKYHWKVPV